MTYVRSTDFVIAGSSRRSYKLNEELDKIAAAFGGIDGAYDDEIAAILAALALKAPLASPALTGTPTTPTPALASNDTTIASTAWVQSLVGSLSVGLPSQSGNSGKYLTTNGTSASWQTVAGASWASLSGKPTTLEGFGITNAQHALEIADAAGPRTTAPRRIQFNGCTVRASQDRVIVEPALPHHLLLAQGII